LDFLMEELQRRTTTRHAEVTSMRAKNLFTPSKHVWGRQSENAKAGVVAPDIWEMVKGGSSEGWTEEEGKVANQVQAYLLTGVNEALENIVGKCPVKERHLALWERVRPWLSNSLCQL
jgi:hypothetical protein